MKKTFMRTLAIVLTFCFTFAFSVSAGTAEIIGNIISTNNIGDLVEYDYVNKTYRTIPASSIPDYASMTTTTYELDGLSSELTRLESIKETVLPNTNTRGIVDSSNPFLHTPPMDEPYSGVVLLMMWYDKNDDGITQSAEWYRGTGFLVAPDVIVTAGHNIVEYNCDVPEVRIYPYYGSTTRPIETNSEYIYPERWICSEYVTALNNNSGRTTVDAVLNYDWCVMKLQEPINNAYYFECAHNVNNLLNQSVAISDYPKCVTMTCVDNECEIQSHWVYNNYTTYGIINEVSSHRINYTNNTKGGNSGSPVYSTQTLICYAIHTHPRNVKENGVVVGIVNSGTIINQTIYNTMSYYINLN